jgi:hypothetical protein
MTKTGMEHFGEPEKPKFTFFGAFLVGILQTIIWFGFTLEALYVFLGSVLFASLYTYFFDNT